MAVVIVDGRRGFRGRKPRKVKNDCAADLLPRVTPKQLHLKLMALLKSRRFFCLPSLTLLYNIWGENVGDLVVSFFQKYFLLPPV